jgi:hypothetical protein
MEANLLAQNAAAILRGMTVETAVATGNTTHTILIRTGICLVNTKNVIRATEKEDG